MRRKALLAGARDGSMMHWTQLDLSSHVHDAVIDGRRVRHLDFGDGPALVLLHGLGCCWQWWLEVIPALAEHHRVLAVDLPGFGSSDPLPPPAEMAAYAETILALADQLELGSLTIAGHSMGGLVTLAAAISAPERVAGVVLVNAGGVPMSEARLARVIAVLRRAHAQLSRPAVLRALATRRRLRRLLLRGAMRDPDALSPRLASVVVPLMAAPGFLDAIAAAGRASLDACVEPAVRP